MTKIEVLTEIKEAVDRYKSNYKTMQIESLLNARDFFATNSYYLADIVAELKKDWNNAYFIRKTEVAREKSNLIKAGSKIGQADADSTITPENIKNFQKELDTEYLAIRCDLLLKSVYQIINSISGRIRHIEAERQLTRHTI